MNYLEKVKEFHKYFSHPVLNSPTIPIDRVELRIDLLKEELKELEEACKEGNITEVMDAFCDIQYVLSGAVLEFGMHNVFNDCFNETHRSNMSKACRSEEEAKKTVEHYNSQKQPCDYYEKEGLYFVYRLKDKKTLKSINYSKVDYSKML